LTPRILYFLILEYIVMNILENALNEIRSTRQMSDATFNNYVRYTLYIYRLISGKGKQEVKKLAQITDFEWLGDTETINTLVENTKTKNSLRGYLNTLNVLLMQIDPELYSAQILRLKKEIHDINQQQQNTFKYQLKNEKEQANWVSWKEVKNLHKELSVRYNELKKKKHLDDEELDFIKSFTILSFYVLNPPRRISDYANLKYVDEKQDQFPNETDIKLIDLIEIDPSLTQFNYIVRTEDNKYYFVFNQYKTKHIYGTGQKVEISYNLGRIITHWIKINKERIKQFLYHRSSPLDSPFMFLTKDNKPLKHQHIGSTLNRIFKERFDKKVSASMLRHSYVSNYLRYSRPLLDREMIATKMGHSIGVQEGTYRKLEGKAANKSQKLKMMEQHPNT